MFIFDFSLFTEVAILLYFRVFRVFLGFYFTFGSAGSLSNVMAGLVLTYMRLFKIGDRVKIGSVTGDVIRKIIVSNELEPVETLFQFQILM